MRVRYQCAGWFLLAGCLLGGACGFPSASVHGATAAVPALVRALPPSGAVASPGLRAIRLIYSVPLDPGRSTIAVIDDAMQLVSGSAIVGGVGHREMRAPLHGALRPGPYSVVWDAGAASGGPVVRQSYLFVVGSPGPPVMPDHPVTLRHRAGAFLITLTAPSDRVTHQRYTLTITSAGRAVSGARVALIGRSLDMEMGVVPSTAHADGPGRYVAVGDVVMAGTWQETVTVRLRGMVTHATFTYQAHY